MSPSPARRDRGVVLFAMTLIMLVCLAGLSRRAQAQNAMATAQTAPTEVSTRRPIAATGAPAAETAELPDVPAPAVEDSQALVGESTSRPGGLDFMKPGEESLGFGIAPGAEGRVPLSQCPYDTTHARECRVHWRQLLITSSVFNAFQNAGNLYTGYWYRWETTHGPWFQRWFDSVTQWRWDRWSDDNPFLDDYVGHPMMGGITNYMWIQNDPKSMTVEFGNTPEYWRSRMRATLYSTAYSFEWKFGPFGEAGVGHNGDHFFHDRGTYTNETGWVELVTTPVGGLLWTMAEDAVDKHLVRKMEQKPHGAIALTAISVLTPARATANIFRFRPPWYRDGRQVKASSFFSEPPAPDDEAADSHPARAGTLADPAAEPAVVSAARKGEVLPLWPHYGGVHEFGAWWGLSLMTGHIWGDAKDIKYMPINVNYSYLLHPGARWNLRYSPELIALAMMDEPVKGQTNVTLQRKRTYGSGVSPVGFRAVFLPENRVQPFLSTNGGALYFADRVLSPQGSQFMYSIDFGAGLTFYRKQRQAVSIGYRYQHLSNADISQHNPGTDANTFYVAVSRFRTKGYR